MGKKFDRLDKLLEEYDAWVEQTRKLRDPCVVAQVMSELDNILSEVENDPNRFPSIKPNRYLQHLKVVHSSLEASFQRGDYQSLEGAMRFWEDVVQFKRSYETYETLTRGEGDY